MTTKSPFRICLLLLVATILAGCERDVQTAAPATPRAGSGDRAACGHTSGRGG